MKNLVLPLALLLAGCAANSGIVSMGLDTYMVSRQAATGFGGAGTLKADAILEASQYCAGKGKGLKVITATENSGPFILGNYPKAEVQFSCIADKS